MIEAGYPGFVSILSCGLMAPAGPPAAIFNKVHQDTVKVLALPDVRAKLKDIGMEVIGNSPAEFAAAIKTETPQWAKVIKDAGIKPANWRAGRMSAASFAPAAQSGQVAQDRRISFTGINQLFDFYQGLSTCRPASCFC